MVLEVWNSMAFPPCRAQQWHGLISFSAVELNWFILLLLFFVSFSGFLEMVSISRCHVFISEHLHKHVMSTDTHVMGGKCVCWGVRHQTASISKRSKVKIINSKWSVPHMTLVPDVTNPNQNLSFTIAKQHCSPRLLTLIFPQLLTDCTLITPETAQCCLNCTCQEACMMICTKSFPTPLLLWPLDHFYK